MSQMNHGPLGGFQSAPIRLAAIIDSWSQHQPPNNQASASRCTRSSARCPKRATSNQGQINHSRSFLFTAMANQHSSASLILMSYLLAMSALLASPASFVSCVSQQQQQHHQKASNSQILSATMQQPQDIDHQASNRIVSSYYIDSLPASTHFSYADGRQSRSLEGSASAAAEPQVSDSLLASGSEVSEQFQAPAGQLTGASVIGKRSSAAFLPGLHPPPAQYLPLVSSGMHMHPLTSPSLGLTRRIMMSSSGRSGELDSTFYAAPSSDEPSSRQLTGPSRNARQSSANSRQLAGAGSSAGGAGLYGVSERANQINSQLLKSDMDSDSQDRALLRQKQHIQYHDHATAGKCHKRTLNFCASVLPFNSTTFPNIIGDTNRFEVKRSLPFFGFLAKSSCNKRLDELLCLLLEPPCNQETGVAIPPCKKFCRLALEGCNEYIPATLALSSVFDCRQYPDANDASECVNLAQGSKCSADEFKCPDETCIPRNWLCDGVRDCVFAADEANCTESSGSFGSATGSGQSHSSATGQASGSSVCSSEEFKCDAKCVPKAWKCDGERDCLDGTDEEDCERRPRCGADRFRCADGNGCIPKRWVCDGKAECRDGSDEMNCAERECSQNDFKCDNGICIPSMWRCDRQSDCKDGSDERGCVYPTEAPLSSSSLAANDTQLNGLMLANVSSMLNYQLEQATASEQHQPQQVEQTGSQESNQAAQAQASGEQLESSLSRDVAQIIQRESDLLRARQQQQQQQQVAQQSSLAIVEGADSASKPDATYDLIGASSNQTAAIISGPSQQQAHDQRATSGNAGSGSISSNNDYGNPMGGLANETNSRQQPTADELQATTMSASVDLVAALMRQQTREVTSSQIPATNEPLSPPPASNKPAISGLASELDPNQAAGSVQQELQQQQQQQQLYQRLPIYRNLFKSLSKSPGSGSQVATSGRRVPVSGSPSNRKRRDRNQAESIQGSQMALESLSNGPTAGERQSIQPAGPSQAGSRAHLSSSVASYLRLLNSRVHHRRVNSSVNSTT